MTSDCIELSKARHCVRVAGGDAAKYLLRADRARKQLSHDVTRGSQREELVMERSLDGLAGSVTVRMCHFGLVHFLF